ncbi:MAG: hypothetical protein QNJ65_00720 [Xenococcaceae cyanobacterium MO_234.B1]|nr:hypothetical protein [Xenococcaceae cyanobacterium MO_234.B1]
MLTTNLLILSIFIGTIFLSIYYHDEIHQLVAFLSGLIALVCVFILSPPIIKGILVLLCLSIGDKIFPTHDSF